MNRTFADRFFGGENVLGRRIRDLAPAADDPGAILRIRGGDPVALANRIREMATGIDPDVRVGTMPLAQVYRHDKLALRLVALALGAIVLSVLLLSAAGICCG